MAGGAWCSLGRVRFRIRWKGELTLTPLIFELTLREPSGATYQMNPVETRGGHDSTTLAYAQESWQPV